MALTVLDQSATYLLSLSARLRPLSARLGPVFAHAASVSASCRPLQSSFSSTFGSFYRRPFGTLSSRCLLLSDSFCFGFGFCSIRVVQRHILMVTVEMVFAAVVVVVDPVDLVVIVVVDDLVVVFLRND